MTMKRRLLAVLSLPACLSAFAFGAAAGGKAPVRIGNMTTDPEEIAPRERPEAEGECGGRMLLMKITGIPNPVLE